MCGGTKRRPHNKHGAKGLSPRVRGNRDSGECRSVQRRSIPACAGEPGKGIVEWRTPKVYPRVCGGTESTTMLSVSTAGLSPRVRGNRISIHRVRNTPRSIPACAGEPVDVTDVRIWVSVYPRVCGGTISRRRTGWPTSGLSPRVRGNPGAVGRRLQLVGSIPACAGEPRRVAELAV